MRFAQRVFFPVVLSFVLPILIAMPPVMAAPYFENEWEKAFMTGDLNTIQGWQEEKGTLNLEWRNSTPGSAFGWAAQSGNVALVRYLKGLGWFEKCRDTAHTTGCYPLHSAVIGGIDPPINVNLAMLEYLLAEGFEVNGRNNLGQTPLYKAVQFNSRLEVIRYLCARGADETIVGSGSSALSVAHRPKGIALTALGARKGANAEAVLHYLESGQCRKERGNTGPFMSSSNLDQEMALFRSGRTASVEALLKQGSNYTRYTMVEALYETISSNNLELLKFLKIRGWLAECRKFEFCVPLHVAAQENVDSGIYDIFLAEGFNIEAFIMNIGTPFLAAANKGHLKAVRILCERGADTKARLPGSVDFVTQVENWETDMAGWGDEGGFNKEEYDQLVATHKRQEKIATYLKSGQCKKK